MNKKQFFSKKTMIFSQWSNKKYSVFQSLKKVIQIACLPLAYILVFNCPALSQTDTIKLEEVTVNSNRIPTLFSDLTRIVDVIQKVEIENIPAQSIEELLEMVSNVDVRQRGVSGVQADISIRGGSFDQVLVLINGVKINDPQTGHHNLNLPVDLENVERIEILEGPGTRIYGQNAFAGAINIITNEDFTDKIKLSLSGGQNNLLGGTLASSYTFGKSNTYISVTKKICDGYITNTDFDITNIFLQSNINFDFAKFSIQAGITDKKFGANSFYTPKYPDQYEITNTTFASLSSEIGKKIKIIPSVYWRRNQDIFQLFRETENWYQKEGNYFVNNGDTATYYPNVYQSWNYYSGHNYHLTQIIGASLNSNFETKIGKTAFGFEYRSEEIFSNKLGETIDSVEIPFAENQIFTKNHRRENASFFVDHSINLSKLNISTGVLINWNSDFNWNYYGGFDASFSVNKKFKIIASLNQSMRMPTYTDLYYQSATNIGNPELKPETAITYETGLKYFSKYLIADLVIFERNGKDIIDWVKINNADKWMSMNYTEMKTYGVEFSAKLDFEKIANQNFFIKNINISYGYLYSNKNSNEYISNYALDYLIHNGTVNVNHIIYKKIGANWNFSYQNRNGTFSKFIHENGNTEETDYKSVNIFSGKIYYRNNFMEIYAEASNILNQNYYDLGNIQMPGFWIKGGLKINILL